MAPESSMRPTCLNCGFAAPPGSEEWETAEDPTFGTMTRCPECGSTRIESRGTTPTNQ